MIGTVRIIRKMDLSEVGHNWMRGRLLIGDVVLCTKQNGDNFYEYVLLDVRHNAVRSIPQSRFGGYVMGDRTRWQPSEAEYHMLMAGQALVGEGEHPLSAERGARR